MRLLNLSVTSLLLAGLLAPIGVARADEAASQGYKAAMDRMMQSMMEPPTGNADIDFAKGMVPHHQAAIDMAQVELKYGTDPEMRKLAQAIIKAQESEIALMQSWLAVKNK